MSPKWPVRQNSLRCLEIRDPASEYPLLRLIDEPTGKGRPLHLLILRFRPFSTAHTLALSNDGRNSRRALARLPHRSNSRIPSLLHQFSPYRMRSSYLIKIAINLEFRTHPKLISHVSASRSVKQPAARPRARRERRFISSGSASLQFRKLKLGAIVFVCYV